ncbi:MAG: undecaprenyl-diphosphatase [Rhodospirillales bacterium]|nr:undecaprenyl-diphosphatase [Rhodospirillales bacterium]
MIEAANRALFLAIDAGAHPPGAILFAARALAQGLVPVAVAQFVFAWVRGDRARRGALLAATLAMLVGLGINQLIGLVYFHPRPFMIGLGHQYLAHPPDNSFPSDHGTFLWSLGFGLLAAGGAAALGTWMVLAGLLVAWARVYLGVHFPFDMAGALLVGLAMGGLVRALHRPVRAIALPPCLALYEAMLRLAHLPPALFPRAAAPARPRSRPPA